MCVWLCLVSRLHIITQVALAWGQMTSGASGKLEHLYILANFKNNYDAIRGIILYPFEL